jgi:hypothetical protein
MVASREASLNQSINRTRKLRKTICFPLTFAHSFDLCISSAFSSLQRAQVARSHLFMVSTRYEIMLSILTLSWKEPGCSASLELRRV